MKLVVGLGNPGSEYQRTRHNVGFMVVTGLAERLGSSLSAKFAGQFAKVEMTIDATRGQGRPGQMSGNPTAQQTCDVGLLMPLTYMNLSGRSVAEAVGFYKIAPADVLVVADDMHLDVGTLRLRENGSSGGHNGLKDIARVLGGTNYPRLRVGVGPVRGADVVGFVLGVFPSDQWRTLTEEVLPRAIEAVQDWVWHGVSGAANRHNNPPIGPRLSGAADASAAASVNPRLPNPRRPKPTLVSQTAPSGPGALPAGPRDLQHPPPADRRPSNPGLDPQNQP